LLVVPEEVQAKFPFAAVQALFPLASVIDSVCAASEVSVGDAVVVAVVEKEELELAMMKGNKVDKSSDNTVEGLADSSMVESPHRADAGKGAVEPAVAFGESVVEGVAPLDQIVAVAFGESVVECVAAVVVAVAVVAVVAVEQMKTWSLFHWQ
jgi:protein involved in polysaccharide export with SLBB domain